jgi:hypothetical protein
MGAAIALLPESGPAAALVAYGMWRSWVETTSGMTKLMASYGDVCVGEKVDQTQTLTSVSGLITYRETGSFEAAEFATRWEDLGLIVTGKALSFKAEFEPFERGDEAFENLTMMTTTSELMTYNPGSNDPKCDKLGLRLMPLRIQSPDVMMINAKAGALTIVLYLPFFSGSPRSWRAGTLIKSARRHCGFFLDTMP